MIQLVDMYLETYLMSVLGNIPNVSTWKLTLCQYLEMYLMSVLGNVPNVSTWKRT